MPDTPAPPATGSDLLSQTLAHFGVRHVFHIPGEGALEILDALGQASEVPLTTCRNEAGMCYAAQGYARAGGCVQPGVCLAGRATGALNAALALHTADTDAVPLILLVGQPAWHDVGGDRLTGFDLGEVFKPMVKAVLPVPAVQRIPEVLAQAWHVAMSSRMGPVVVLLPEDVLQHSADGVQMLDAPVCTAPAPSLHAMQQFKALMQDARRPLLLLGGTGWYEEDREALRYFLKTRNWPVACAYRRADVLGEDNPSFVGEVGIGADPALLAAVSEADCLLVLNMRLGEINTFGSSGGFGGWKLLERPRPQQRVIHVHADARELQRNYQADLPIPAAPGAFLHAALSIDAHFVEDTWRARLRQARLDFVAGGKPCPGPVDVRAVMRTLREQLPPNTPVCVGAGAYAVWLHRYFAFHPPHTLIGPKSGAMGYGLAAAVGAARCVQQPVLALAGDGCLQMHAEELATAVQYRLPILLVVLNNAAYAAIEGTQRGLFSGRTTGTRLGRIDFAAWARSMGAQGLTVVETAGFAPALQQALAMVQEGPVVIDVTLPDGLGKPQ